MSKCLLKNLLKDLQTVLGQCKMFTVNIFNLFFSYNIISMATKDKIRKLLSIILREMEFCFWQHTVKHTVKRTMNSVMVLYRQLNKLGLGLGRMVVLVKYWKGGLERSIDLFKNKLKELNQNVRQVLNCPSRQVSLGLESGESVLCICSRESQITIWQKEQSSEQCQTQIIQVVSKIKWKREESQTDASASSSWRFWTEELDSALLNHHYIFRKNLLRSL